MKRPSSSPGNAAGHPVICPHLTLDNLEPAARPVDVCVGDDKGGFVDPVAGNQESHSLADAVPSSEVDFGEDAIIGGNGL